MDPAMSVETWPLSQTLALSLGGLLYIAGGLRFRRWAVEDRAGIPRYSERVETVMLWMVYSGLIAMAIVVFKQTLRHL